MKSRIKNFNEISINDVDIIGGKKYLFRRNVYYENFDQVDDLEVKALLNSATVA